MARTMMIASGVPPSFWAEAILTAAYILNRAMIRPLLFKIAYGLIRGRKPNISHLRTFGCGVMFITMERMILESLIQGVMKGYLLDILLIAKHTGFIIREPRGSKKVSMWYLMKVLLMETRLTVPLLLKKFSKH